MKAAFYAALLVAMVFSAMQLYVPEVSAGICCTYGNQCPSRTVCCIPHSGMADCSPSQKNYCLSYCGV